VKKFFLILQIQIRKNLCDTAVYTYMRRHITKNITNYETI